MEKFKENFKEALKHLQIADHLTYVTLPLIKEKRLLLKVFDEIYKSVINCINSILHYEYYNKRICLYNNPKDNLETFFSIAKNYGVSNEQIKRIREILEINRKHKQSSMEFVKKEKVIIMLDNLKTEIIDMRTIKEYLLAAKELLVRAGKKFG